jgi:Flp pilus assembly protein TadD
MLRLTGPAASTDATRARGMAIAVEVHECSRGCALAAVHAERGEYEQAIDYCQRALAVHQETGDREGEATAWDGLGYAYHRSGDRREARLVPPRRRPAPDDR